VIAGIHDSESIYEPQKMLDGENLYFGWIMLSFSWHLWVYLPVLQALAYWTYQLSKVAVCRSKIAYDLSCWLSICDFPSYKRNFL